MCRNEPGRESHVNEVTSVNPKRTRFDAGFTLIEITIAVLLFALVVGSIYEVYIRGEKSQQIGLELAEANQNARSGVDLISREIRSAGYGVDPSVQPSIVVGSQYRITFALDMNGNQRIDMGEVVTYFLDPSTSDPLVAGGNPYDFVLRRKVGTAGDSLAAPVSGTGEIVAYGITQRTADNVSAKNVPLFSYRDNANTALELKAGTANDAAGVFYGKTVNATDLGIPPGPSSSSKVKSVLVNMVTETKQKNLDSGSYDRVTIGTSVEPRNFPFIAQANQAYAPNTGGTGSGTGTGTGSGTGTGTATGTATGTGTGTATGTGSGTGLPPSQPPIHIPTDKVLSLALGDLNENDSQEGSNTTQNGQHDLDIVVGTRASGVDNIRVWWNGEPNRYSGNVYFRSTQNYLGNASYDIPAMAIANVDTSNANARDLLCAAVTGTNTGRFQVWKNQAFGGLGEVPGMVGTTTNPVAPNASYYDSPGTGEARALAVRDLNGDGRPDVVIGTKTNANQGKVEVWWNSGNGVYSHAASLDVYTASGEVRAIALNDMNQDGYPDIVVGTKTNTADTQGTIDIFFNNGLSTTRFTTVYTVAVGGAVYSLATGRMNAGDGYPDVVIGLRTGNNAGKMEYWQNNGTITNAVTKRDEQVTPGAGGATPPAVQAYFCDPNAANGAIIPPIYGWADANAGGSVNAVAIGKLECSQDHLDDDPLADIVAGTATGASTGDLVIYLNPYSDTIYP
jgi:prepilin-type N-terminal cleavage/methylation domain-containing protein